MQKSDFHVINVIKCGHQTIALKFIKDHIKKKLRQLYRAIIAKESMRRIGIGLYFFLFDHRLKLCIDIFRFLTDETLQIHVQTVHTTDRKANEICEICGKGFDKRGSVINHIRTVHQTEFGSKAVSRLEF